MTDDMAVPPKLQLRCVYRITHNARLWKVVADNRDRHFVQDDRENLTGPYSTKEQAADWVEAIRP